MRWIDRLNELFGYALSWCMAAMVLSTFLVVVLRYFFGTGWAWLQEVPVYLHAILFLGAAGYGLLRDSHVRVDIFYRKMTERKKAWVDLLGVFVLLFPTLGVIFYQAWPYVLDSWRVKEVSPEGGIPAVFLLKTWIFVYCVALALQGLSLAIKSVRALKGIPS